MCALCPCALRVQQRRLVRRDACGDRQEGAGSANRIDEVLAKPHAANIVDVAGRHAFDIQPLQVDAKLAAKRDQGCVRRCDELTAKFGELSFGREIVQRVHAPAYAAARLEHFATDARIGHAPGRNEPRHAAADDGDCFGINGPCLRLFG